MPFFNSRPYAACAGNCHPFAVVGSTINKKRNDNNKNECVVRSTSTWARTTDFARRDLAREVQRSTWNNSGFVPDIPVTPSRIFEAS